MIALRDALPVQNVLLNVAAENAAEAVGKAVALLKNDPHMLDWPAFAAAVAEREKSMCTQVGGGLLLPHGRGEFVSTLLISFLRLQPPILVDGAEVRFVIAVAVPSSMAVEYLRMMGALARAFLDEKSHAMLTSFKTPRELIDWLGERCR